MSRLQLAVFLLVGRITFLAKEKRESLLASTSTGGGGGGIAEDKLDDFMRQVDELRIELEREKERMDAFLIGACFSRPLRRCPFGNRATHSPTAWHRRTTRPRTAPVLPRGVSPRGARLPPHAPRTPADFVPDPAPRAQDAQLGAFPFPFPFRSTTTTTVTDLFPWPGNSNLFARSLSLSRSLFMRLQTEVIVSEGLPGLCSMHWPLFLVSSESPPLSKRGQIRYKT